MSARPHCRLKIAIIAENFLPKVDGVTVTLMHLLEFFHAEGVQALLLGPRSGMEEYAGCRIVGAFGFPLRVYPGLKVNFIPAAFIEDLREFDPDVIHLVDPIWLGVQALVIFKIFFPDIPIVTSQDTNLPTYAQIFGFPYFKRRSWQIMSFIHSLGKVTLVPSQSTAGILGEKGFVNLRVCDRGADLELFNPSRRSPILRERLGIKPGDIVILSAGRLSPEKNLFFLIESVSLLSKDIKSSVVVLLVGDGPLASHLKMICQRKGVRALFLGHLSGAALGEAFASADIMSSPSFTETFGQVTLEAMASGLPVVGLYAEGTAGLVTHWENGLLLDVHVDPKISWSAQLPLNHKAHIASYDTCAPLLNRSSASFHLLATRFSALLEQIISDSALRANMAEAALSAAQGYPWERCTNKILDVYTEVAAIRSRSTRPSVKRGTGIIHHILHALGVGLAILVTFLSHMLYMIPTFADLCMP